MSCVLRAAARRAPRAPPGTILAHMPEPGTVDYARSFFPVALVVLVLRAFVFEPFRIPSDSMMPTLLDGDFIIVNKYAYGLRLPVLNHEDRGDRRAAARGRGGVPLSARSGHQLHQAPGGPARGSRQVKDDKLIVNGEPVPSTASAPYNDGCYVNMRWPPSSSAPTPTRRCSVRVGRSTAPPRCRPATAARRAATCAGERGSPGSPTAAMPASMIVPPGHYLMIGRQSRQQRRRALLGVRARGESGRQSDPDLVQLGLGRKGGPCGAASARAFSDGRLRLAGGSHRSDRQRGVTSSAG